MALKLSAPQGLFSILGTLFNRFQSCLGDSNSPILNRFTPFFTFVKIYLKAKWTNFESFL
tara:strand:+ start:113 stop:292 length:180 start_codon:yes stop_codon:yes gene_type:complete